MGRLLTIHPCAVCNYHVEDQLHEGGSGIAVIFLSHHYVLAICKSCNNLVSVLVANTESETQDALKTARSDIIQMEADAVIGDPDARDMLPLFRQALDRFDEDRNIVPAGINTCSMCGSHDIEIVAAVDPAKYDDQDAWVQCPRCAEGQLLVETTGTWN